MLSDEICDGLMKTEFKSDYDIIELVVMKISLFNSSVVVNFHL